MRSAIDFAKYFMNKGFNETTFDGRKKLQKLLFFAYLIHLARTGTPLFSEEILAFEHGCVVEEVRKDYAPLVNASKNFKPSFDESEDDTLKITLDIFGDVSACDLSDINHKFNFWDDAYNASKNNNRYGEYNKSKAVISPRNMENELEPIRNVLVAYEQTKNNKDVIEQINGIKFHIDPSIDITDEFIKKLEDYTKNELDETSYAVYYDEEELVIY